MKICLIVYIVIGLISMAYNSYILLTNQEKIRHMLTLLPPELHKRALFISIIAPLVLMTFFWPCFSMKAIASYFESES